MLNPIEAFKALGNASQAVAIAAKLQKIDPNKNGTPEVQELVAKGKEIVGDLNELNKDCIEFFALYQGLVGAVDDMINESEDKK